MVKGQEGLLVDFDTGVVRQSHVLVQSGPGVVVFLGLGSRTRRLIRFACDEAPDPDPDPFIAHCRRIALAVECGWLAKAQDEGIPRAVLDIEDRALRRLAIAEALAKAGYNPAEPRDADGRWTSEGDGATTVAGSLAGDGAAGLGLGLGVTSLFDDVGPGVLAGLSELGAGFAAPVVFLGVLFIPTNSSLSDDGTLPDRPDVTYHYDLDTGTLTLARDGAPFYIGHIGADGVFRDQDGRALGRGVDSSLILDPDALPGYASRAHGDAPSRGQAQPLASADTDHNEPKLCPDPERDRPSRASPDQNAGELGEFDDRAAAYQFQVTGLPPGLAVKLTNPVTGMEVYFDGCRESDGTMLEAKGPGYQWAMIAPDEWMKNYQGIAEIMRQAANQSAAAGNRNVEWYFAEEPVANYFMKRFEQAGFGNIIVLYLPYVRQSGR